MSIVQKVKAILSRDEITSAKLRLQRRRRITNFLVQRMTLLRALLYVAGYTWLLLLPLPQLGRGIYIDENALQPGQVNTYWDWSNVHSADLYLGQLEELRDRNASKAERADFVRTELLKMGISSEVQPYTFALSTEVLTGQNAYGVLSAPRSSGTEAIVISASWISQRDGIETLNLRGVATILALAKFSKGYSLWAKDLIFVVTDDYMSGMHAFLSAYHDAVPNNLATPPLNVTSGVIWTALNIEYPGHSFSEIGIFHEGLNARLPNQDLINSFHVVSAHTGLVQVTLYDTLYGARPFTELRNLLPSVLKDHPIVDGYLRRARYILQHTSFQTLGKASGPHGLFHQYRIDAFTLYAIPATGPHGFHAIGKIMESTLRTTNNLLERLHASLFFYIFTTSGTFLKIGAYLPSVICISLATMIAALQSWVNAGWQQIQTISVPDKKDKEDASSKEIVSLDASIQWTTRPRPVLLTIVVMLLSHGAMAVAWRIMSYSFFRQIPRLMYSSVGLLALSSLVLPVLLVEREILLSPAFQKTLKAFSLSLTSTVLSITSLLNFSLSAVLSIAFLPTNFPINANNKGLRTNELISHLVLASLGLILIDSQESVKDWELFGVWFAPFITIVYIPLFLQAALIPLINILYT
ncbi:Gaa1-like protein [Sistotremastrum niveocremeum HHB9708]|uniref:Gaa1-like protein n=1 Tax=Sistotremastrum niveocremeum HHB9708 TaxID=1314777 RepID=A0A164S3Z0_9AGAM|nr:Gaa1-like protein [Sistotremastrum niveocremeum HHB9708]